MNIFFKCKSLLGLFVATMLIVSCASSDQVVSNKLIQKRKYTKGFFVNKVSKSEKLAIQKVQEGSSKATTLLALSNRESDVEYSNIHPLTSKSIPISIDNNEAEKKENEIITIKPTVGSKMVSRKVRGLIEKANRAELNSKKQGNKKESKSNKRAGDDQIVALLLAFFVGGLGIHRFYLGYTWQGVVQLLTLGGCGIWSLIDFIRILVGDLGPKDGGYSNRL